MKYHGVHKQKPATKSKRSKRTYEKLAQYRKEALAENKLQELGGATYRTGIATDIESETEAELKRKSRKTSDENGTISSVVICSSC